MVGAGRAPLRLTRPSASIQSGKPQTACKTLDQILDFWVDCWSGKSEISGTTFGAANLRDDVYNFNSAISGTASERRSRDFWGDF